MKNFLKGLGSCILVLAGFLWWIGSYNESITTVVHDGLVDDNTTVATPTEVVPSSLPVTKTGTVTLDLEKKMSFPAKAPKVKAKKDKKNTVAPAKAKKITATTKKATKKVASSLTAEKVGKKNKEGVIFYNVKGEVIADLDDFEGVYFIKIIHSNGRIEYGRSVKF